MMVPMPRGTPRVMVSFLLAPQQLRWLDDLADTHEVSRTFVIRAALALAKTHTAELTQILKEKA